MRNMSFALTTRAVRQRDKTVTRRLGWKTAKAGDIVQPVVKGQGIPKGGKVEKLGAPIRFISVRRERVEDMQPSDVAREGFGLGYGNYGRNEFIRMFCQHNGCTRDSEITRIEFEYVDALRGDREAEALDAGSVVNE